MYICHCNLYFTVISKLTIYRASAGSGKTYTLTREYIKLLLKGTDYHRRILTVTFTNKATEEMKSRIIRELYHISTRHDPDYIKDLAKETGRPEQDVIRMAGVAMHHLLHDYSHFSVVTIDSFFQKVIRSFAREMGLYAAYNIELDQTSVLDASIDLMLDELDRNDFLKDWLVEWARKKIEDGKSWNFKADIHRLGHEVFSEQLQDIDTGLLQVATDKSRLEQFIARLENIIAVYTKQLASIGQKAISIMDCHGLAVDDFAQKGNGVGMYFRKLSEGQISPPNTYVLKALDDISGWYSKNSPRKNDIEQACCSGLNDALQEAWACYTGHACSVASARVVLKQLNVLGILSDLMHYVNAYTRDQNLFLLAKASGFLKTIIANADTPFIYERAGSFYEHFMIDEFQDTSSIQWDNFRPLVGNSLASGNSNWIVGDVKQSIYRWRNTDWKILAERLEYDLGAPYVTIKTLDRNWRSAPEIIQFNNTFFRNAVKQMQMAFLSDEEGTADPDYLNALAGSIMEAYHDFYQHLPEQKNYEKGYVRLSIIPEPENDEETGWQEKVLSELPALIEELQDLGYGLSDIAILVRENKESRAIADMLLEYGQEHPDTVYRYDVLSNESLLVKNASSVKWLVAAMQFIVEPDDCINKAYLQYEYEAYLNVSRDVKPLTDVAHELLHHWRGLPVYELSDKLIQEYDLYDNPAQAPFIQAFQDILLQYTRREATDVRSFLSWWDEAKDKKFMTMPDNQDAIRLLTIHKAKGLEFKAVIIPFCDWPLAKDGRILWCKSEDEPFNSLELIPLKFETALRNTVFVKDFLQEKILSYIDNLNLLYVAFTRACKTLFIYTPQQQKNSFTGIRNLIHNVYNQPVQAEPGDSFSPSGHSYIDLQKYWQPDISRFESGSLIPVGAAQKKTPAGNADCFSRKYPTGTIPYRILPATATTCRQKTYKTGCIWDGYCTIFFVPLLLRTTWNIASTPS